MAIFNNKLEVIKSQKAANESIIPTDSTSPLFQLVDGRPETTAQQNMQSMMNGNAMTAQLSATQKKMQRKGKSEPLPNIQNTNNTGLPDNLKSGVEQLSGFSMDDVKVHYNSSKPAQFQANAYAQGTDIHIASGQEKYLGHEAWHVVQQKQGRVKPTMKMNGANVNDNQRLEKEADVMGGKAMQVRTRVNNKTIQTKKIVNSAMQFGWPFGREEPKSDPTMFTPGYPSVTPQQSQTPTTSSRPRPHSGHSSGYQYHSQAQVQYPTPAQEVDPILSFGQQMLTPEAEDAYHSIQQPESRLRMLSGAKDVLSVIVDEALGDHSEYKEAISGASKAVFDILRFIQKHRRIEDITQNEHLINELYDLIRNNIGNIEPVPRLATKAIRPTSIIPYWGIIVKVIQICDDSISLYRKIEEMRRLRSVRSSGVQGATTSPYHPGVGSQMMHSRGQDLASSQYQHAKTDVYWGIYNLSKHATKLTLKTIGAAGVTAPFTKILEALIGIGQITKTAVKAVAGIVKGKKGQTQDRRVEFTGKVIGTARGYANYPSFQEYRNETIRNLEILGLNNQNFCSANPKDQVIQIFEAIR